MLRAQAAWAACTNLAAVTRCSGIKPLLRVSTNGRSFAAALFCFLSAYTAVPSGAGMIKAQLLFSGLLKPATSSLRLSRWK